MPPSEATLTRLHAEHALGAYRFAWSVTKDEMMARDVVQDLFLKLARDVDAVAKARSERAVIFTMVREEHARTSMWVCRVAKITHLLEGSPVLEHSIAMRNPYVDPLSYLQVELLARLRAAPDGPSSETLEDAILLSVSGIAAGLKNTG